MADSLKVANAVNAAMSIASMVVGQYYMAQINNKMASIQDGIDNISEFQDMEYRSRVMALVAAVQQSATFKYEIMASDELRTREMSSLKNLEIECARLLGQANLVIQERTKDRSIDYAAYERLVNEVDPWFGYQQILLRVMDELAELTYTLSLGAMSRENSYALCNPYTQQCAQVQNQLAEWHGEVVSNLEIDLVKSRRWRYQRVDRAIVSAVAEACATGTSTRRARKITSAMGIERLNKAQARRHGGEPGRQGRRAALEAAGGAPYAVPVAGRDVPQAGARGAWPPKAVMNAIDRLPRVRVAPRPRPRRRGYGVLRLLAGLPQEDQGQGCRWRIARHVGVFPTYTHPFKHVACSQGTPDSRSFAILLVRSGKLLRASRDYPICFRIYF